MTVELLLENTILFNKIVDDDLLMSVQPAGESSRQKMERVRACYGLPAYPRDGRPATVKLRSGLWTIQAVDRCTYQLQPNGRHRRINFGNNVSAANNAMNIANAVNTPKYIVGVKLDSISMENPKMIVIVV